MIGHIDGFFDLTKFNYGLKNVKEFDKIFTIYSKAKSSIDSRSLFVPDIVRRFFVRCAQIYEAYVARTLIKFVCI